MNHIYTAKSKGEYVRIIDFYIYGFKHLLSTFYYWMKYWNIENDLSLFINYIVKF